MSSGALYDSFYSEVMDVVIRHSKKKMSPAELIGLLEIIKLELHKVRSDEVEEA